MKKGWEYIALSSVCKVQNGFAFNSKMFNDSNKGLPLIRIRDIKRGYSLTYTDEACSDDFFVEDGDMLIGMDGDFNIGEWKGGHALLNQRVCKLIPSEKVLAKFIFYVIPEALRRINDKTAFSTVKHLSSKQVNAISLPKLDLSEQQRIVDYLDAAFAKIDAMKANAEKSLNEAKSLFQASLKEMLEPKEGWEKKKLGEIATKISDGSHNPPAGLFFSEYEMLSSKNIRNDLFNFDNPRYLSKEDFEKEDKRTKLEKGDVLLTIVGAGLGECCVYNFDKRIVFQRSVSVIKPSYDLILSRFLMYTLQNNYISIRNASNGAAQKGIYLKQLATYTVWMPYLSEQQSIVATLDSLKSKVDRLQANFEKISQECDALKQAILRQVFE